MNNGYKSNGSPPYTCAFCKHNTVLNRVDIHGNKKVAVICKKLTDFNTPISECKVNMFGTCSKFNRITI